MFGLSLGFIFHLVNIYFIHTLKFHLNFIAVFTLQFGPYHPKVLIGILTEIKSPRIPSLQEVYINKLLKHKNILVKLVNYQNYSTPLNIRIPSYLQSKISHLKAKHSHKGFVCFDMMFRYNYFLEHALLFNIPWIFRLTDDAFVNTRNIEPYIRHLNSLGNPYKEVIAEGQCCGFFYQGGSGWVLSRYAAKKWLELFTEKKIIHDCLSIRYDDVIFYQSFIPFLGVHHGDFSSPYFHGNEASDTEKEFNYTLWKTSIQKGELENKLPECPTIEQISLHQTVKCKHFIESISNIVVLHFHRFPPKYLNMSKFEFAVERAKMFFELNSTRILYYYKYDEIGGATAVYCSYHGKNPPLTLEQKYSK